MEKANIKMTMKEFVDAFSRVDDLAAVLIRFLLTMTNEEKKIVEPILEDWQKKDGSAAGLKQRLFAFVAN